MKFAEPRPLCRSRCRFAQDYRDRQRVEIVQDSRIYIEKINGPMLLVEEATPAEYKAGLDRGIENGWLDLHESGAFVRFTQAGADLFASS